jgi:hypothetical protein
VGPFGAIRRRKKEPVSRSSESHAERKNIQLCTNEAGMPHARVM